MLSVVQPFNVNKFRLPTKITQKRSATRDPPMNSTSSLARVRSRLWCSTVKREKRGHEQKEKKRKKRK